jgi:hypothetical protein
MLKKNINTLLEKLNVKKTIINDLLIVYRLKDEHIPWWTDPYYI